MIVEQGKAYAHFLTTTQYFNLNHAACVLTKCGWHTYIVGSVLKRQAWRDVDLRCIMFDDEFDKFIGKVYGPQNTFLNVSISEWLSARTKLPIDFQFQRMTDCNKEYPSAEHPRNFIGFEEER